MKKKILLNSLLGFLILSLWGCTSGSQQQVVNLNDDYDVAAFFWPSTHDEPRSREVMWGEGIGEWEVIRKGDPRFKGHYQPRVPLWGYEMEDDPAVMEKKINAAADHGVNIFIFDWFWFDGGPWLESTLNNGFLKAANRDRMEFFLFWGNHDVPGNLWNYHRYETDSLIFEGEIEWENFRIVVDRVINQYFKQPNYFKIEGKPVFAIFSTGELINSFEGLEGTKEAFEYFRAEVTKAGFPGLHLQVDCARFAWDIHKYTSEMEPNEIYDYLGINSVVMYTWYLAGIEEDYIRWAENGIAFRDRWDSILEIPFIPNVSMGWDNTPRYPEFGQDRVVHMGNTPESFAMYLQEAREYLNERPDQPPLIILNAWNEYVEGSYLEPDMKWGYGYLEAVKKVMSGKYDKYY